jgi:hypothetical protein
MIAEHDAMALLHVSRLYGGELRLEWPTSGHIMAFNRNVEKNHLETMKVSAASCFRFLELP